MLSKFIYILFN